MEKEIKKFIASQNQRGRFLWLRPLLSVRREPFRYPIKRYYYLFSYVFRIFSKRCQPIDWENHGSVFYICLAEDNERTFVAKLPRLDTRWACELQESLRSEQSFSEYKQLLMSLPENSYLGRHVPEVYSVRRDGGYDSALVEGENLANILVHFREFQAFPANVEARALINAVDEIEKNLKAYWASAGKISGDWALHNLMFEHSTGVIKNVDLEGFHTYNENRVEAQPDYILAELRTLTSIVELILESGIESRKKLMVLNSAWYSTGSDKTYNGSEYFAGYHSFNILGSYFRGQRECSSRLADVPYDFTGKVALDLGCNCGGMLHSLADKIAEGIGFDRDTRCINTANLIREVNGTDNLHFFSYDLELENLDFLENYLLGRKVDVCFLLSMCMWLDNWKRVVEFTASKAKSLVFESNGSSQEQKEQIEFVRSCFKNVSMIAKDSPDDPGQKNRSLYLCEN